MLTQDLRDQLDAFFRDKRCLVTGGAGFIGSTLWKRLVEMGANTHRWDRKGAVANDVTEMPLLRTLFEVWKPQVVFHLAAMTEVLRSWEDPWRCHQVNVLGTLNVLECCRLLGSDLSALVVASSDKAYGRPREGQLPFREDQPLAVQGDPYSCSKRIADQLSHDWARNFAMPVRVLRCCNVYGPGQRNQTTLITGTVARLLRGEKPVIHVGHERAVREWLFIDDAVDAWLLAAMDASEDDRSHRHSDAHGTHALNVGSGHLLNTAQMVDTLFGMTRTDGQRVMGREDYLVQDGCPGIPTDCWLDSSRFRTLFPGWSTFPLREGLGRTVAWHRESLKENPS